MLIKYCRSKFDPDVRSLVAVKFIHGFWRREDERRTDMMVRY
jgi:tyrosyl-DNA phosphodiesterase-1